MRTRLLDVAFVIILGLLGLNVIANRTGRVQAVAPHEYKQIQLEMDQVPATLNAQAKDGWEFAQVYQVQVGTTHVYLILKR